MRARTTSPERASATVPHWQCLDDLAFSEIRDFPVETKRGIETGRKLRRGGGRVPAEVFTSWPGVKMEDAAKG